MELLKQLNVHGLPGPILIVSPHPDDDVLGTGGMIQVAEGLGKVIYILYITAGDANKRSVTRYLHKPPLPQWFRKLGYVRFNEAVRAENYLGIPKSHLFFLGFPDGLTYSIATDTNMKRVHQSSRTNLTSASYSFAYVQNAPYSHQSLLNLIVSVLIKVRPGTIFVTLGQDTNPDHAGAPLILNQALHQLGMHPAIFSYLIHFPQYPNHTGPLRPPAKLRVKHPVTLPLSSKEVERKRTAFSFMKSQARPFYQLFFRQNELFWG